MANAYDSTPCDKSSGNDHPTQTLWSRVINTEDDCIVTPEDDKAKHEIEFRNVRRRAIEGKLTVNSTNECIEYDNADPDDKILEEGTKMEKHLVVQPRVPQPTIRYPITACSDQSSEDYLKTSLSPKEETNRRKKENKTIQDGGDTEPFARLELVLEVTVRP